MRHAYPASEAQFPTSNRFSEEDIPILHVLVFHDRQTANLNGLCGALWQKSALRPLPGKAKQRCNELRRRLERTLKRTRGPGR
jgi:hypothetical protein